MNSPSTPPLIMHVIFRLAMGGLENGLVNLINHMPPNRYRHAIVCLTDFTEFRERIHSHAVSVLALHKKPGLDLAAYGRLWKMIKDLKPMIVHTRNLPTLEMSVVAALAGVPCRIHGEHGRDIHDQYGASQKFLIYRKLLRLAVHHYVAVSQDLGQWLREKVRIHSLNITQIYNGVNSVKFSPSDITRSEIFPSGFAHSQHVVIGTVGRLQEVKDQHTLIQAVGALIDEHPQWRSTIRLVIVGDGPLRQTLEQSTRDAGIHEMVWMAGAREDIHLVLRAMNVFVLPSEAEGISNTILEAMATGLPVIATRVGGNAELVVEGKTGLLIPPKDPQALQKAILQYLESPHLVQEHGKAGRARVEQVFSMQEMVNNYLQVYDAEIQKAQVPSFSSV